MTDTVSPDLQPLDTITGSLATAGYWAGVVELSTEEPSAFLKVLMARLGTPYIPDGCSDEDPIVVTAPSRRKSAAPFDRPEAIGWHGDFASHEDRPQLSLVLVVRSDPVDPAAGAWRLASTQAVLNQLATSADGRAALDVLEETDVPFSYSDSQPPRWFRVIDRSRPGARGLRFYAPSITRGYRFIGQDVPPLVAGALERLSLAADQVQVVMPTQSGSLLVIDNWKALHDRTPQTVRRRKSRQALLGFVNN